MLYITFLPFGLWQHLGYYTVAFAPLIAFMLAGIENIGVMIENPIRILPMGAFCAFIQCDVMGAGAHWAAGNQVHIFPLIVQKSRGSSRGNHKNAHSATSLMIWLGHVKIAAKTADRFEHTCSHRAGTLPMGRK
jgi:hypothetical protein